MFISYIITLVLGHIIVKILNVKFNKGKKPLQIILFFTQTILINILQIFISELLLYYLRKVLQIILYIKIYINKYLTPYLIKPEPPSVAERNWRIRLNSVWHHRKITEKEESGFFSFAFWKMILWIELDFLQISYNNYTPKCITFYFYPW